MKDALINSRYLLLEPIGSGGEARVFRAHDNKTGKDVAARLALKSRNYAVPNPLPFFHAGWARFFDGGTDPQHGAYQVFELLEGETLGPLIKNHPLDSNDWLHFVNQSLEAVAALHDAGWIHGDLNADNFILTHPPASRWKLLELPFLRFDPPSGRSALFGSIHTLAPEQIDGAPADVGSDLYALGCLYYYAASGEFPHAGDTSQAIAIERLRFAPAPLAGKAPALPATWSAWVMTLLERDPKNRFPSASAARQLLGVA